jgi:Tol biopolymer transport system component
MTFNSSPTLRIFTRTIPLAVILCLMLLGCSLDVSQPSTPTSSPQNQATINNSTLSTSKIPVTWSSLNLTGYLIYISGGLDGSNPYLRIQSLDLASGDITTIFDAPKYSWIYFATVSSDAKQIVMAYSPPAEEGGPLPHQRLYAIPLDGTAQPQQIFTPPTEDDEYLQPQFSQDGKYLYFVHVNYQLPFTMAGQQFPIYEVCRMKYPNGQLEKIADQAFWPRPSADSSRLVYISYDAITGNNRLFLANMDGTIPKQVTLSGASLLQILDAPLFAPDNRSILFSAVNPTQTSAPGWLEKILGITVASAHTIPSDWWVVPVEGGMPIRITQLSTVGLFASVSPDGKHIASHSGSGIFVMNVDGTELTMLIKDTGGIVGTVSWVP